MKKIRFAVITIVIALLLGSFFVAPSAPKSIAGAAPKQSFRISSLPDFSPFLLGASAQIVEAGAISQPETTVGYSCSLTAQRPADWTTYKRRTIFDTYWTLKNTGQKVWGIHGVDVMYRGGTRMHTSSSFYDLPTQVGLGKSIVLSADMIAPKTAGYYVSNWGLYLGSQVFCKYYVVIYVSG